MRRDPASAAAARARLLAMTTGAAAPREPVPRRTAARRAGLSEAALAALADLPDGRVRLAADPAALDRLLSLAAAIEMAEDIAGVIDREEREALDAALGGDIRAQAMAARALSGPRLRRSAADLIAALPAERARARVVWAAAFPSDLGLAGGAPCPPEPLDPARRERLSAALRHAETAILAGRAA